jgi:hypothetical protein
MQASLSLRSGVAAKAARQAAPTARPFSSVAPGFVRPSLVAMARVESEILSPGFVAPDFELPEPLCVTLDRALTVSLRF